MDPSTESFARRGASFVMTSDACHAISPRGLTLAAKRVMSVLCIGVSRCYFPADMAGCRAWRINTRRGRNGAAKSTAPFFVSIRHTMPPHMGGRHQ
jgi:hypothetical protein